jgi:predicted PurR-regulated permease PerM
MQNSKLFKALAIVALLLLIVTALILGKPFLVPLTFAALLAMLLLPVTRWLELKGVNKALATLAAIMLLISFFAVVLFFIGWQMSDIASNTAKLQQTISEKYEQAKDLITQQLGVSEQKQDQIIEEQQKSSTGKMTGMVTGVMGGITSFLTDTLLVFVYVFLFIYLRSRIKGFIIRLVPLVERQNAMRILDDTQQVTVKYLSGLFLMIVCLWVMYGIGFSLLGVENAIFFAILCGLLEIVPFIGNLTGTAVTIAMSVVQGGDMNMVIGILLVYGLVQFIQTYLLEPMIVGAEVSINPLFTIIGLVAGELIWGIPGMILAIPLLGITKIVFEHIEALKPFAYLIGSDDKKKDDRSWMQTVKSWFKKPD